MSLCFRKKKIFMKNYSKEDNVRLIKLVEQNECLWNCKHWEYFKKSSARNAWEDIGKELNDTPRQIQQRWRTIRNNFVKHIHPTLKNKIKKYYLDPYLDFLRPFIRSCCRSRTCCQLAGKDKIDTDSNVEKEPPLEQSKPLRNEAIDITVDTEKVKVKSKNSQEPASSKPIQLNSNMMFFESLLPFVDEMTNYQTRRLRLKVLTLIDDILD